MDAFKLQWVFIPQQMINSDRMEYLAWLNNPPFFSEVLFAM